MPPAAPSLAPGVRLPVLVLLAVLGVGVAPAGAQRITPRFAWPAGSEAEVTSTYRTMGAVMSADSNTMRMSMRLTVTADPRGLVVAYDAPRMGVATGTSAAVSSTFGGVLGMRSSPHIVSRDGHFVDYADTTAVMQQADSMVAVMRAQLATLAPAMAEEMRRSAELETLRRGGREHWLRLAGDFTGRAWSPGDSAVRMVRAPFPLAPGALLELPRVSRFEGVVACPGAGARTCWRFTSREHVSAEMMRPALQRMMSAMGAEADALPDEMMAPETETVQVLVVDAATFRPLREETTTRVTMQALDGMSHVTMTVIEYAWR